MQHKAKKWTLRIGLVFLNLGIAVLSVFVYWHISREIEKQCLLDICVVLEIPDLNIKAPVMDGTGHEVLSKAAGHFPGTGALGEGNYCIAGHKSTIYAEIFNEMKHIKIGMEMHLYDNNEDRMKYTYIVTKDFIVEPNETWVLKDFGDDRITIVTCTDDGTQRQIVVGMLKE